MKLNNHGWGFREMLFYLCILIAFLLVAIILIVRMYHQIDKKGIDMGDYFPAGDVPIANKKETLLYSDLEVKIKNGSITYIKNYYNEELGSEVVITLSALKSQGIITDFNDIKDGSSCNGYVVANYNEVDGVIYHPYIKCSNYTTNGYDEGLD